MITKIMYNFIFGILNKKKFKKGGRHGVGAQGCDCKATVVGPIPTRGNELLFLYNFIFSLWYQDKSSATTI